MWAETRLAVLFSLAKSLRRSNIPPVDRELLHPNDVLGGTTRMADYLQPVGRAWRITSIVGCTLTSIICLLLSLLLWTDMIRRHSLDYEGKPLWMGATVVGVIGVAAAFIAWRLVRRHAAANGVTVMPTWFIQLFGVFLLSGLCFVAYHGGSILFMVEGVFICLAMICVGRRIAKRQRQRVRTCRLS